MKKPLLTIKPPHTEGSRGLGKQFMDMAGQFALEHARMKRQFIAECLVKRLGNNDWTAEEVMPRMERAKYPRHGDGMDEVIFLEGWALCEIRDPWFVEYEPEGIGYRLKERGPTIWALEWPAETWRMGEERPANSVEHALKVCSDTLKDN